MRNNIVLGHFDDLTIIKFFETVIGGEYVESEIRYIEGLKLEIGTTIFDMQTYPLTDLSLDSQGEILSIFGDYDEETI